MSPGRSPWWARSALQRLWEGAGCPPVELSLWDGFAVRPRSAPVIGQIEIGDPGILRRMLWDPSLGLGEGYSSGRVTILGDLRDVLTSLMRSLARREQQTAGWRRSIRDWFVRRRGQSPQESRSSVYHHYDLGNDFYSLWLDDERVYTCAYYARPEMSLEEAQIAKFDLVCRKLRLREGETVVEAGCGWGGFAFHMAREYGVRVRAYNLSREQLAYARERARAEGLSNRVEFIEADYRDIDGACDVFVSIGMLEHVGVKHYPVLGAVIDRVLKPEGRGLIHTIGRNVARPLDSWTERYIFPGAEPPSLRQMMDIFEPAGLSVVDVENLRLHYARTCAEWLARFETHRETVARMFDERFARMWQFYLAGSSSAFRSGYLQLFQVLFTRSASHPLPLTRDDIYSDVSDEVSGELTSPMTSTPS